MHNLEVENGTDPTIHEQSKQLCDWIRQSKGYDFSNYEIEPLTHSIQSILKRLDMIDVEQLISRLIAEPAIFPGILSGMTITTSSMFRDPRVFVTLVKEVLPYLQTYSRLKIWHAGCAQGEEVYSLAILLHEHQLLDRTMIYATDINPGALEKARDAIFPARKVKEFAKNYFEAGGQRNLSEYYELKHGYIRFNQMLRSRILFSKHDLVSDTEFGEMNLILCRNVMIYFDGDLRARALRLFRASLCVGGFLCLGLSESMPRDAGFQTIVSRDMLFRADKSQNQLTSDRKQISP